MIKESERDIAKYLLIGLIFVFIFLSYLIVKSYAIVLISTFILAYLFKPIHSFLSRYLGNKFSAFVCMLLVLVIFILPLGFIVGTLTSQAYSFFNSSTISELINRFSQLPIFESVNVNLVLDKFGASFVSLFTSALSYLPGLIISLFIMLFAFYYVLSDWNRLVSSLERLIPLKDKRGFIRELDHSTKGIVYGIFFIGLIQFIFAWICFSILDVPSALLLSIFIFFTAFIPGVGPGFVWVPLAIYYAFMMNWFMVGAMAVIGLIIGFGIDEFLASKILGDKAKIHPVVMLVGILGGVVLFGIFGFIIGPLILSYTIKILQKTMSDINITN